MNRIAAVSPLRTRMQILLWRRGWAWPLALLALAAAAAMHALVLRPLHAALAVTHAELAREQSAATTRRAPVEQKTEGQELAALQDVLRASPEPAELVRQMSALAQAEQIGLQQSDYQQQPHSTTRLVQVHVTQPVRATYPRLRRYVESVLRTVPNASLDHVAAHRENVAQTQLEARLRWSFWIQRQAAPAATQPMAASAEKKAARDLFSTRRWNPPPPPPPHAQPAPPPVAPPLPYAFLGKKLEGETWEVFLSKADQSFVARTGQVLENDWRVDKIAPPTLTLTYLPLGLPQTLSIGDTR